MVYLDNEPFLHELTLMYHRARDAKDLGYVTVTMKRYDGRTKPVARDQDDHPQTADLKCLFRAKLGNRRISTVVNSKDVNKFQQAYSNLLKASVDNLKKRDKKVEKKTTTRIQ